MKPFPCLLALFLSCNYSFAQEVSAPDVIEASGVKGGVAVVLGCDAELAAQLGSGPYLVHILDTDQANIEKAREAIDSKSLYGKISIDKFDGTRLPYVDNLVNLIVDVTGKWNPSQDEIARVLAPRGVYLTSKSSIFKDSKFQSKLLGNWAVHSKLVPSNIDDWTHFLHGPNNNAVAKDSVVGPPRHMQWVGGPKYGRHHDKMSSFSASVSANGRVFYIIDEAPPFSILTAPQWKLVARDAFNGTTLWKRDIKTWTNDLNAYKSGPAHLPRKLVAVEQRVFVTLDVNGPALALDAATGETIATFKTETPASELMFLDNTLYVVKEEGFSAFDVPSGKELWNTDQTPVRGSLAIDEKHAVFLVEDRIICLNNQSGKQLWRSEPVPRPDKYHLRFTPTLIIHDDIVLWAGGEKSATQGDGAGNYSWRKNVNDTVNALSLNTGKALWTAPHPLSGYASSEDLFVIDDVVWCGETTSGHAVGHYTGHDVKTGKIVKEFDPDVDTYWFHHRCYRAKATERFILTSRTGIEFVDPKSGHWDINHWVRGACLYGVMPANGLIYAPQNPCACFLESRMDGFSALASSRIAMPKTTDRLQTGTATVELQDNETDADSWPTYRGNNARSGCVAAPVSADLQPAWTTEIGGRLSSLTIAGGRVFVAAIDRHQVVALDQKKGTILWRHTAGGRVDSPPTIFQNSLCIFGSRDGNITALRASDGKLAWRFRAAPIDRRVMAYEQLESAWPVNGSVLIQGNVLFAAAGRSLFLDGGIRLLRLDPASGKLLSETILNENDDQGEDIHKYARQHNMPVSLPDILSFNGEHVFMRSQGFTLDGKRLPLKALEYGGNPERYSISPKQDPAQAHIFSPTGFLDDTWWHRTYWMFGSRFIGGWAGYPQAGKVAPAGRILVFDKERVYGYGRQGQYYRWTRPIEHHLFAARKTEFNLRNKDAHFWTQNIGMHPRGLVKADKLLFLAGPEDFVDENVGIRTRSKPEMKEKIRRQAEACDGRHGGFVRAVNSETGEQVSQIKIESIPVFDGMAVANGKLYISLVDGQVTCLEKKQ